MHHAGPHGGRGPGRLDRVGQAFEAVAAHDQHVFDASVAQLSEHPQPVLGALAVAVADPDAQHMLAAVEIDAHSEIGGPVGDVAVADLDVQRVDEDDRIDSIEGPAAPRLELVEHPVGDTADQVTGHLHAVDLAQMGRHVAHGHAPGVQGDDLVVEPFQARRALGHDPRLKGAVAVPGSVHVHSADVGVHPLGRGAVARVARPRPRRVALLIAQMISQLLRERPLEHRLGELGQKPVRAEQFGALGADAFHHRLQRLVRHQRRRVRRRPRRQPLSIILSHCGPSCRLGIHHRHDTLRPPPYTEDLTLPPLSRRI